MADQSKPRSVKPRNDLTTEFVRSIFRYDGETGDLRWCHREDARATWNSKFVGKKAGRTIPNGYVQLCINNRRYYAHRVIWLYVTGEWPIDQIDHRDNARANNRFDNLREATEPQNHWNSGMKSTNTSGFKGVTWNRRLKKWAAFIAAHGKTTYLGTFETPDAAHRAYCDAADRLHGDFAKVE